MELTRLEIKGFKSFGDRVVINFDRGITGIVGPNGCGKSNVVDAIRWVLGEQKTRMLRSDKMENVIFNGTRNRKAQQLAEVSLTFNNTKNILPTEYTTVTITRRYYRTGESEYLLNGVVCRLKDITNLFMDTGIATNSYAIIELKMVDDILNDKDNSRRQLFEEAAGISKFKTRKKETLKKLADTDADLDRVEDLLYEIEKNMRSLERQARQAKRYFKLKEEYKSFSVSLALKNIERTREKTRDIQKKLEGESDLKVSLRRQVSEKEAEIEKVKASLLQKEKLLSGRQRTLNDHVAKIRQMESDKKIKNERLRFLSDKADNLRDQIEQDKKSNERAHFSIQSLSQEKEVAEKQLRETENLLEEYTEAYEDQKSVTSQLQEELNDLAQRQRSRQDQVYQLKKSLEIKQMQLSSLKQELERTASDTSEQRASLDDFEDKEQELREQLDQRNSVIEKLKAQEEHLQERLESTEKTLEMIREERTQLNRKLDARQNEYSLTKSLVENLEGFPEAIKFLKKSSKWAKDAPLLSDIITCEDKYRVTIENYLEPYMNYFVVETEAQAYQAVNLLSEASRGRANFFMLDRFDTFKPHAPKLFNNAIPATEIVEYDGKYRHLVSYILDKVYLVQGDRDEFPDDPDCLFISESGRTIRRPFSISGGSVGLFEGKRIGRAKNLEKLEKEIKSLEKKLSDIQRGQEEKQKELNSLRESTVKTQIDELQKEINRISENYVSIRTKKEQLAEMLTSAATRREDMQDKIEVLVDEVAELEPKVREEQEASTGMDERVNTLNSELVVQNELLTQNSSRYNQQNILFHQQQNKVNSVEQEISFKQAAFESSRERLEKNQGELKRTEEEVKILLDRNEEGDDQLVEMYHEKESIEAGVNEAEKDYYESRGQIDKVEKDLRGLRDQLQNTDTLVMELQQQMNEAKLSLASVKERLSVEFEIDLDNLPEETEEQKEAKEGMGEADLKERVQDIKQKIEKIGPVNPMAMEAYEEISERHTFISQQKKDLHQAKDSLLQTIDEIDTVAKENFLKSFEAIKANFIKVFRSLFTEEDECDLKLTDPDSPLESSIEIMAKPKGKRPLTINQLSGGEKTLTATSLLFAIYLLKPAPFCIFDEVDAPLDDANIDKFNKIIKKFSEQSQFIIVTHNKRTMASTDVIYGVTMVESVSRVVAADLREMADLPEE
ncbi:chromosome segregation protein SMC [Roseivirga sp. BDSF3-8]|uniref:chromosome segregation protein SMC n=1 Tax=Roseivirga sp. BDSF3-8 TaxID=3241598 RepID=UPI003531A717